ncbi:hypothetical protein OH76DRAFT_1420151 [Lentinus brumalis]|uniref:Uncharacterized protein n=1 Tax=Lentinus brumalis TaxID=2498619 RepID=A0A371D223_9APHY|nr:hypothetical protein OH76DRAFT_1420151 [Polyporus brumalis]
MPRLSHRLLTCLLSLIIVLSLRTLLRSLYGQSEPTLHSTVSIFDQSSRPHPASSLSDAEEEPTRERARDRERRERLDSGTRQRLGVNQVPACLSHPDVPSQTTLTIRHHDMPLVSHVNFVDKVSEDAPRGDPVVRTRRVSRGGWIQWTVETWVQDWDLIRQEVGRKVSRAHQATESRPDGSDPSWERGDIDSDGEGDANNEDNAHHNELLSVYNITLLPLPQYRDKGTGKR